MMPSERAAGASIAYLNGRLLPLSDAHISPLDRGLLLGDAVFETMRAYAGRPFGLEAHLRRLEGSCAAARLPFPTDLTSAVRDVLKANDEPDAAVRITLTRGPGGRGASPMGAGPPTVLITVLPIAIPPEIYEKGVRAVVARRRRMGADLLDPAMKTTNYLVNVLARIEAEDQGADDALFFDDEGNVVEATQANVFAVFGKVLATPPLSSGCLPGTMRATVLGLAPRVDLVAFERPLARADLAEADEIFLSSSITELAPLVELDGVVVGGGRPGPATRRLHALYRQHALDTR